MEGGVSTPSLVPFVCTQKRRARVKRARERERETEREGESERRWVHAHAGKGVVICARTKTGAQRKLAHTYGD